ncbi:hypothetical protein EMCRGX_G014261 [Ephydatia muelleri]|eukprot:Em0005g1627a
MAAESSDHISSSLSNDAAKSSDAKEQQIHDWVKLNVGGIIFMTTVTTLCKEKDGFLARLCKGDTDLPSLKDEHGAYLIDRDPRYFHVILNYLRHGKFIVDGNLSEEGILEEAEFYNLPSLVSLMKQRSSGCLISPNHQNVYRVLHCQEGELTQMLSTLGDGWKMTQLVNIGSQYSYSSQDQSEFLVVVSKEFNNPLPGSDTKPTDKEKALKQHGSRM